MQPSTQKEAMAQPRGGAIAPTRRPLHCRPRKPRCPPPVLRGPRYAMKTNDNETKKKREEEKMLGFNQFTVKKNERALLLRNGDFDGLYAAGKHRVFTGFDAVQIERFSLAEPAFDHELADYFLAREPQLVQREFVQVSLGET